VCSSTTEANLISMNKFINAYAWFVLAIVLLIVANVIGRYFFDLRFDFAVDASWQLYAILIMLGASYSLAKGTHIRADIYYKRFNERTRMIIDLIGYAIFFPAFGILTYVSAMDTYRSVMIAERSSATMSQLVIYPMKIGVTLGLVLLLVQAFVNACKCLRILKC